MLDYLEVRIALLVGVVATAVPSLSLMPVVVVSLECQQLFLSQRRVAFVRVVVSIILSRNPWFRLNLGV